MLPIAVLAGGLATRLGSLTKDLPKCLIEISGKPFVDWQIELLRSAGYVKLVFCISYKSELVQNYLGDGSKWGVSIEYSLDGETQLGTGGAIKKALPLLGERFAVIYGDSYLPIDYQAVEESFLESNAPALMTVFENNNNLDQSNVQFEQGQLLDYKKESLNPKMHHIDYGLTYFQSSVFADYPDNSLFDLSEVSSDLSELAKLSGFEVFQRFYEIGSVSGIAELSRLLEKESS